MRTLQFTHEEVETILHALGIAEKQCGEVHNTILDKIVLVRRNFAKAEQKTEAMKYHDMGGTFADLSYKIHNGEADV